MGWDTDGTAAVAADAAGGTERRDGRRLPSARPAGRALQVPGIVGAAGDVVVALVAHEELGAVRLAQDDGAGGAQAGYGSGIGLGAVALAELAAGQRGQAG